jgi:YfiH family protein
MKSLESKEAIGKIDDLFASVGLKPGSRATLQGTWSKGERIPRKLREKPAPTAKKSAKRKSLDIVRAAGLSRQKGILHGFSTRPGGLTTIYRPWLKKSEGELNLSWTKDDAPANVAGNRRRFLREIQGKTGKEMQLVTLRQLHSPIVQIIEKSTKKLATPDGKAILRGDGMMTDVPNLLLGIQTADCIPILVYDPKTRAVAAFHAGWRPTLARIVERGVGRMRLQYGSNPKDLIAAIGPGIGPCCYAVGEEIRYEFESQFAYWKSLFTEVYDEDPVKTKYPLLFLTARAPGHSPIGPQTHLNLWEANRRQLLDAGLLAKNITVTGLCTACNTERFFSHRAERGFTGRMLNVIGCA